MTSSITDHARQFEFAILGAGAIGSIIGAHLARAGHSVVMLVRERRARQINSSGLQIRGLAEFTQPVTTLTDMSQLHSVGTLIVAMKTQGTVEALAGLQHVRVDAALSIQNGLLKNDLLAKVFGHDRVLGSLANTSGELLSSGDILFTRNVNVLIGGLVADIGLDLRAQKIATQLDAAGVRSTAVPDILGCEWSKFAGWAGFMMLSVVTRLPTARFLLDPDAALLLACLVREVATLADACQVTLTDQSMLPVATMARGTEHEAVEAVLRAGRDFKSTAPEHRMSSLQDLDAGRALEVEATLGYAVRRAAALELRLPLLDASYRLVASIDRNRA